VPLRRGHTLAEALCALALGAVLAVASAASLTAARRALDLAEERDLGGRAEREAVAVVRRALATGSAATLRGDTAVDLDLLVGVGVACAVGAHEIIAPWPASGGLTLMPQLPAPDDLVAVRGWRPDVADWQYAVVDSVSSRVAPEVCAVSDGWRDVADATQPVLRLVLSDSLSTALEPGAELRVYRRGRFALYHAGSGDWMLGWRRCHPWTEACGPIQPVAGPLQPPGVGGFRVALRADPDRWELSALGVGGRGASAELPW
jgi:hypothetical protein